MLDISMLKEAVIKGNAPQTKELTQQALQEKISPEKVLKEIKNIKGKGVN